jgi:proteic killer suppression protein
LKEIYRTGKTRRIGADHIGKCERILQLLEVAGKPEDMNVAGFRFHGVQGRPKRRSVRVTGNYRITFGWSRESALDVDFEDYHEGGSYGEKERTAARSPGRDYQGRYPAVGRAVRDGRGQLWACPARCFTALWQGASLCLPSCA